jgi:hypothetical protein
MTEGSSARATIELTVETQTPEGVLIDHHGRARSFSGWIELAAAVEDWRTASTANDAARQRTGRQERRPARQGENS